MRDLTPLTPTQQQLVDTFAGQRFDRDHIGFEPGQYIEQWRQHRRLQSLTQRLQMDGAQHHQLHWRAAGLALLQGLQGAGLGRLGAAEHGQAERQR